jgi:peroxiredoxin
MKRIAVCAGLLITGSALLSACQREASIGSVTAPITTPTTSPTIDPRVTDLERVKPGMAAPDFSLTNHDGVTYRLSDYRGKKNVVLVFYRGFFCSICITQLGSLKSLLNDREKKDIQLMAVSEDSRADTQNTLIELSKFPGKTDFLLLEDRGHAIVDSYGLQNPAEFKPGIPYPATYIIDKQGKITHRFLNPQTYERATNEQIRDALRELGAL